MRKVPAWFEWPHRYTQTTVQRTQRFHGHMHVCYYGLKDLVGRELDDAGGSLFPEESLLFAGLNKLAGVQPGDAKPLLRG
eukprot:scaffold74859_cov17-Prasinocladus_malaysianus.AAC.2